MKPENLMYGHTGNGVVVYDRNRIKKGDYMAVAHISYHRNIKFYIDILTDDAIYEIRDFAQNGNMAVSVCNPDNYALCPLNFLT